MKKKSVISAIIALILIFESFSCFAQDADSVLRQARSKLVFSVLSSEDIENVTEDLYLPGKWEGTDIYWKSSNETYLSIDGEKGTVSRPPYGDGRICVVLSAHIGYENKTVTRNFMVRIEEMSIGRQISTSLKSFKDDFDRAFLSNQNLMAVRDDLIIPQFTRTYMTMNCISENPEIITDDGKITRSMYEDKIVNFTVNFTYGYERTAITYPIIVKSMQSEELSLMAREDMDWVLDTLRSGYNLSRVTGNMTLPVSGPNNSTITYSSSNSGVLSDKGIVNQGQESNQVELTITLKLGNQTITERIDITVSAKNSYSTPEPEGGSPGGGTPVTGSKGNVTLEKNYSASDYSPFKDVSINHWAKDAITGLEKAGVINGDGTGNFRPDDYLTREELVKMVVSASGIQLDPSTEMIPFTDIYRADWCYPYVYMAYLKGIVRGRADGTFGKGENITRQDTSVIIYNNLVLRLYPFKNNGIITFDDAQNVSEYAKRAVSELQQMGLINGKGGNMFMPNDKLTRAEAATMIWRMMQSK